MQTHAGYKITTKVVLGEGVQAGSKHRYMFWKKYANYADPCVEKKNWAEFLSFFFLSFVVGCPLYVFVLSLYASFSLSIHFFLEWDNMQVKKNVSYSKTRYKISFNQRFFVLIPLLSHNLQLRITYLSIAIFCYIVCLESLEMCYVQYLVVDCIISDCHGVSIISLWKSIQYMI